MALALVDPIAPSIADVRYIVLAVGPARPPYADDVQHYPKLLRATRAST